MHTSINLFIWVPQPPAFPKETPESIKEHIEEKYLMPGLDADEFSPEKVGRQWEFDWFEKAKIPLEPSLPRTTIIPVWEIPFRRQMKEGRWEPKSMEVNPFLLLGMHVCAFDAWMQ